MGVLHGDSVGITEYVIAPFHNGHHAHAIARSILHASVSNVMKTAAQCVPVQSICTKVAASPSAQHPSLYLLVMGSLVGDVCLRLSLSFRDSVLQQLSRRALVVYSVTMTVQPAFNVDAHSTYMRAHAKSVARPHCALSATEITARSAAPHRQISHSATGTVHRRRVIVIGESSVLSVNANSRAAPTQLLNLLPHTCGSSTNLRVFRSTPSMMSIRTSTGSHQHSTTRKLIDLVMSSRNARTALFDSQF